MAAFENRQPATAAKFTTKSLLFIVLLGIILPELKPNGELMLRVYSSPRHSGNPSM